MFTWMRTHQRKLWLVITILTIVSFIVLYNSTQLENLRSDSFARVYGKDVSLTDFQRKGRKFQLAIALGLTQYASTLGGGGDQGIVEFVLNSMIVEHEGKALGIAPTDEDVKNAIVALPVFQTNGQFDPKKYAQLVEAALAPQGFTEIELQDIVRSSLVLQRIQQLLDSAPAVSDAEHAFLRRMFQPVSGAAVVFKLADFAKGVTPSATEIDAYFKANAARFVTPEWRAVRYVSFPLPADAQKLEGKAKIEVQQKVADASDAFAARAATEGFEKAAQALGLEVKTTPAFDQQGQIKPVAGLDSATQTLADASPVAALAPTAFTLSPNSPVSGVIQNGDTGFLVAELANSTPSRPMTLDEARPGIVQALTDTAARAALQKAATDALAKLRAALKAGQPFAQAAAAAGLQTETFTNLSLFDQNTAPAQARYGEPAARLEENEVSGFQPGEEGGFLVWLEKRAPLDEKTYAQYRDMLASQTLSTRERILWLEWLRAAQKDAGIVLPDENRG